jgi:hypothetical protein
LEQPAAAVIHAASATVTCIGEAPTSSFCPFHGNEPARSTLDKPVAAGQHVRVHAGVRRAWVVGTVAVLIVGCGHEGNSVVVGTGSALPVVQISPGDVEYGEGTDDIWQSLIEDPLRGVEALKTHGTDEWMLVVNAMEFVRQDESPNVYTPLVSDLEAAARAVRGVRRVDREDNEVWLIEGVPSGRELVEAVARVLDRHEPQMRAVYESSGDDAPAR